MSGDANVSSSTRGTAVPQNNDLVGNFVSGGLMSQKRMITPEGFNMNPKVYDTYKRVRTEDPLSTSDISDKGPKHSTPGDLLMRNDADLWARDKYNFRGTSLPQNMLSSLQQLRNMAGDNGLLPPVNKNNMFTSAPNGMKMQAFDDLANKNNNSSSGSNVCVLNTIILNPSNYRGHFIFGNAPMETDFIKGQILYREPQPSIKGIPLNTAHVRSISSINKVLRQYLTMSYKNWCELKIFNGNGPVPLYPSEYNGMGDPEDPMSHFSTKEWTICGLSRDKYLGHNLLNVAYDGTYQDFPNIFLSCPQAAITGSRLYTIYTFREEDQEAQQQMIEFSGKTFPIHPDSRGYPRIETFTCADGIIPEYAYHTRHISGTARQFACVQYPTVSDKAANLAIHAENVLYPNSHTVNKITDSLTKLPFIGIHVQISY
jgi:hypothetical protein